MLRKHSLVVPVSLALAAAGSSLPVRAQSERPMVTYYLALLRKGPADGTGSDAERQEIRKGHFANMDRLWKERKMLVAGPASGPGEMRGVFVLKAASLEEAHAIAQTDPAIKAGHFAVDIHPWKVEKGTLPDRELYCEDP